MGVAATGSAACSTPGARTSSAASIRAGAWLSAAAVRRLVRVDRGAAVCSTLPVSTAVVRALRWPRAVTRDSADDVRDAFPPPRRVVERVGALRDVATIYQTTLPAIALRAIRACS